jgi:hypothetical protein
LFECVSGLPAHTMIIQTQLQLSIQLDRLTDYHPPGDYTGKAKLEPVLVTCGLVQDICLLCLHLRAIAMSAVGEVGAASEVSAESKASGAYSVRLS